MDDNDYAAMIDRLSPARRRAFDILDEGGPQTGLEVHAAGGWGGAGTASSRISELVKLGLVRQAKPGKRGGKKVWEVTPPAEVEAALEAAGPPRIRGVKTADLDARVAAFTELLSDPEVQEALEDPAGTTTKRQRAKVKAATERARRERRRQLKALDAESHPSVEAMRLRHAVEDAGDYIRSLRVFNEEDWERRTLLGQELVFGPEWSNILREIEELERQTDAVHAVISQRAGLDPRPPARREFDLEYDDGEVVEIDHELTANGNGDQATLDLIEKLGGPMRLALPAPSEDVSGTD